MTILLFVVLVLAVAAGALIVLILRAARNPEFESLRRARLAMTAESSEPSSELQQPTGLMPHQERDLQSKAAPRV